MNYLTDKKISVVIPCYNEAENIEELHKRIDAILSEITQSFEVIFVDNKSTDETRSKLRHIAENNSSIAALFFSRNFGNSQYGYTAGTKYASGDAVIWMEADLQDPPEVIKEFVKKWNEGFKVVYGVREVHSGSMFLRNARKLFYRIFSKLSYVSVPVDAGDFCLLDRQAVDIFNSFPERSRFVRGIRAWIGLKSAGVKYERLDRKGGVTSNPSFRNNLWWARKFIFSFSNAPFEFIFYSGIKALIFAPIFTIAAGIIYFLGSISLGVLILIIIVVWFFSIILFSLGLLAEAVGIMFEEIKGRPQYIIEEIVGENK